MQRRSFLRLSAVTFTSLLGQAGCSDSGSGGGSDPDAPREVVDGPEWFPQSVLSGDPRATSVILWTRVVDPDLADEDYEVELEIWPTTAVDADADADADGMEPEPPVIVTATAEARFDHCVKLRAEALVPGTEYSYRFVYTKDGVLYGSREGLTKTAPDANADVPVRFAFVSCQDFGGRYYNSYAEMQNHPLDFFVHLGDYIYETAGDESFQEGEGDRAVQFDDTAGALEVPSGDGSFFAARSLDNYRQLYRTFRSDAALQAVHERLAMVAIWDDHEFSDDCYGSTATYRDGREDETDPARRAAANQAWFEYMPVDYGEAEFVYDPAVAPPDDIRIYRDIEYGQHVHLVMTDLRSYRPDHLVPEDAYPGAVPLDETALADVAGNTDGGVPYVDIEAHAGGSYLSMLRDAAAAEGYDATKITGNISAVFINDMIEETGSSLTPLTEEELAALPRGLAFHQLFKTSLYGQLGARYLVVHPTFMWYADWLNRTTEGAQSVMGATQQQWFLDTMQGSERTWKIWGNEFCLTPLNIDLTGSFLPEGFRHEFQMTAEDWNGFPHRRAELIDALAGVDNVVAITGDIHAFFAGTPFSLAGQSEGNSVVEFVTGSISSGTYRTLLVRQVDADPTLSATPGIDAFALGIRDLLTAGPNPQMAYAEPGLHGFGLVEASGEELRVDFHTHNEDLVLTNAYDDPALSQNFTVERFRVLPGARDLYREIEGEWQRWDAPTRSWVAS